MLTTVDQLPTEHALQSLFDNLFVPEVNVSLADLHLTTARPFLLARYEDGEGCMEAIVVCDTTLATCLGAAITLAPHGMIADLVAAGAISEDMFDNAREVFNIASRYFVSSKEDRHVLKDLIHSNEVDENLRFAIQGPFPKRTYSVNIDRYGKGKMTFIALTEQAVLS